MPKDRFCRSCNQLVNPKKNREFMHPCLFILLCLFTAGIGGLIYLIIYYRKDKFKCPICGLTGLEEAAPEGRIEANGAQEAN
jgi:predicted RNA-binding Zn-ribbon protein involved in translation (DUF1610 family)